MKLSEYRLDYPLANAWSIAPIPTGIACGLPITRIQRLYVLKVPGGYFKIGISKEPYQRRRELQCGSPHPIEMDGTFGVSPQGVDPAALEREVHELLAIDRASGEWFKCESHLIGRAIKEAFVKLYCPPLYQRWQRFRLHCSATAFRRPRVRECLFYEPK